MTKNGISKTSNRSGHQIYEDQELELATQSFSALEGDSDMGVFCLFFFFNVYSEDIMREALHGFEGGVRSGGEKITDLRYADHITLIM